MESADEVFRLRQVNGCLTADSAVHHRQQSRRDLDESDTPHVSRRHKPCKVADDTTTDRHYRPVAWECQICQPLPQSDGLLYALAHFT